MNRAPDSEADDRRALRVYDREEGGWSLRNLVATLEARGETTALTTVSGDTTDSWTARTVAGHVHRIATALLEDGLEPEEPVTIFAPNSPQWIVSALSVMAAGGALVPLDDLSGDAEVKALFERVPVERIFTVRAHLEQLDALGDARPRRVILLDEAEGEELDWRSLAGTKADLPELPGDATAALFATSGTTGAPKIFALTHGNLAATVRALDQEGIVGPEDRALLPLPLHHAYPTVVGMLTPLTTGTTIVLPEGATGPQMLKALEVSGATLMVGVPRLYDAMVGALERRFASRGRWVGNLYRWLVRWAWTVEERTGLHVGKALFRPLRRRIGPRLRLLVSGGAHVPAELQRSLEGLGWLVLSGYGLAETTSVFTCNRPRRRRLGSAGQPLGEGEVRIAEADENGVGEVQLRGAGVTPGYRDAEDNREAFAEGGWFRTGDLGWLDDKGFLFIVGRRKEMLVLGGGKKVNPEDLEKVYGAAPAVEEMAVLERNGALVALVRPNMEAVRKTGTLNVQQAVKVALSEAAQSLPAYQRLSGIAVTNEALPRTRLGKYRRFLLGDIYERALSGRERRPRGEMSEEERKLLEAPAAAGLWKLLEARFPDRDVALDSSLALDLGLDSFGWMELGLEIEQRLGISLNPERVSEIDTVRELLQEAAAAPRETPARSLEKTPAEANRWLSRPDTVGRAVGGAVHALNRALMLAMFRVKAEGDLPEKGPFLIAANHVSDLDPLVLAAVLPRKTLRQVYWAGDVVRLFGNPVTRYLARVLNLYPVDERDPRSALAMAKEVLRRDLVQVWFPEGWRSPDGAVQTFLPGVGHLLREAPVPVVPTYIAGTYEAMPRGRRLPRRTKVKVRFGEAIAPAELPEESAEDKPEEAIAALIRERVVALEKER